MKKSRAAVAGIVAGTTACSLVDLSGFSEPRPSATVISLDAEGADARGGSNTADASSTGDASPDGSFAKWCASQQPPPSFCDDFESESFGASWHDVSIFSDGGALERVPVAERGATYALRVRDGRLRRNFPQRMTQVDCAFDVALDAALVGAETARLFVVTWNGPDTRSLEINLKSPATVEAWERNYGSGGGTRKKIMGAPLPLGQFRRLRFVYELAMLHEYEDGVASTTWDLTWVPPPAAGETAVELGLFFLEASLPATPVRIDDFSCTLR